jgi:hypothetical protein
MLTQKEDNLLIKAMREDFVMMSTKTTIDSNSFKKVTLN